MKRFAWFLLLLPVVTACATMDRDYRRDEDMVNAPPPPTLSSEPQWRYLPDQDLYVPADDDYGYDMFRVGSAVYLYNDGYWYRTDAGRTWNGDNTYNRFIAISDRRVPRQIFRIDDREYSWRQRPGAYGRAEPRGRDRDRDRGRDQDHDHDYH